jgi:hypothetical protein
MLLTARAYTPLLPLQRAGNLQANNKVEQLVPAINTLASKLYTDLSFDAQKEVDALKQLVTAQCFLASQSEASQLPEGVEAALIECFSPAWENNDNLKKLGTFLTVLAQQANNTNTLDSLYLNQNHKSFIRLMASNANPPKEDQLNDLKQYDVKKAWSAPTRNPTTLAHLVYWMLVAASYNHPTGT